MTETVAPYVVKPPEKDKRQVGPRHEHCQQCGRRGVFYSGYCPSCSLPEPGTWVDFAGRDPDPFGR